jgi:hypothetical protein
MDSLVFLEPNKLTAKPFTTSEVIAEYAQVKHHAIQQMIAKHETVLKAFGVIAFEMRKPPEGSKPEYTAIWQYGKYMILYPASTPATSYQGSETSCKHRSVTLLILTETSINYFASFRL